MAPQNQFVSNVASQVALMSAPFTEAQQEQLLNVLATSVHDATAAANLQDSNPYRNLSKTTDWPRALAQAQTFLSPTQFSTLKGHAAQAEIWALIREFCLREGIPAGR